MTTPKTAEVRLPGHIRAATLVPAPSRYPQRGSRLWRRLVVRARLRAALRCASVARSSIALWPVAHNSSLLGRRDRVSVADELPT
jgi:hypothetical protein